MASAFATLLVLFIANPRYPQQLNAWITGAQAQPALAVSNPTIPSFSNGQWPTGKNRESAYTPVVLPSEEVDRRYVESLLSERSAGQVPRLRSSSPTGIYTVREFVAEDGKRVLVYTQLDDKNKPQPISISY